MSYARSPRPLCSITIGIRPRPVGSCILRLLMWCRLQCAMVSPCYMGSTCGRFHKRCETCRAVLDPGPLQRPADDVVFDRGEFEVVQALGLLIVPADDRVRLFVA